jgi:hypothetical protein
MIVHGNPACRAIFEARRPDGNSERCHNRDAITALPVDAVSGFPVEAMWTPSTQLGTAMAMGCTVTAMTTATRRTEMFGPMAAMHAPPGMTWPKMTAPTASSKATRTARRDLRNSRRVLGRKPRQIPRHHFARGRRRAHHVGECRRTGGPARSSDDQAAIDPTGNRQSIPRGCRHRDRPASRCTGIDKHRVRSRMRLAC